MKKLCMMLALVGFVSSSAMGTVVYEAWNSYSDGRMTVDQLDPDCWTETDPAAYESIGVVADDVHLAGTDRNVTQIDIGMSTNGWASTDFDAVLRLYTYVDASTVGAQFFEAVLPGQWISSGFQFQTVSFTGLSVTVPDDFYVGLGFENVDGAPSGPSGGLGVGVTGSITTTAGWTNWGTADETSLGVFSDAATLPWGMNVRIDAVPEPATLSLLGLGGLFSLIRKRRC